MEFIYQCPVCRFKLDLVEKSLVCPERHTYDISREGYVNLLLANQKNSKDPGDSKLMAECRQNFLDKGFYNSLSEEINKVIGGFIAKVGSGAWPEGEPRLNILDVGCGVGFYSGKMLEYLGQKSLDDRVNFWGIDISKSVVQKAAKRYTEMQFAIGSSFHLPYLTGSLDIIFSIFSPFEAQEIFRVLKPGGIIMVVRPGANHLKELGELIYGKFQLQGNQLDLSESLDVKLIKKYQLNFDINLETNEDLMSLVNMTPYCWHLNDENKATLAKTKKLTTGADFQISLFQRKFK